MSYDGAIDTITVWGNNGSGGYTPMGNNESNPITFERIFEFGQAVRGICAVTKPASGSYAILSRLELGNTSDPLNTTFVETTGESLSFGKQLQLNFNATLISGRLTTVGSPFTGSKLSFSGLDATDSEEGQFFLTNGSELRLYDSGVSHTVDANSSEPFRIYWNGNVKSKSSTLQNWYTIRFAGANNSLEDVILTNLGEGFYPAKTQIGTLNIIKSRNIDTGGLVLKEDSNTTITALEIAEATNDILVINYTGTANLLNPSLNFSNINWTTGSFSGQINRKYDYETTIKDSAGIGIENVSLVLLDVRGDTVFDLLTDSNGEIPEQTITRAIYDYNFQEGDEKGPHTLLIKKYKKNFVNVIKTFSAATVETAQLSTNLFTDFPNESAASSQTGIIFTPPTKVAYSDAETKNVTTNNITLDYSPITQSEYFALFNNSNGKLISSSDYNVNYSSGFISFVPGYDASLVRVVYSYGGSIRLTENKTSSNIYDYIQANKSDVFTTATGSIYDSYVDIILDGGGVVESTSKTVNFKNGFGWSATNVSGSTINVDADEWNFVWRGATNGTFYRRYNYDTIIKNSGGVAQANATIQLLDVFGNTVFNNKTGETGALPTQVFTLRLYESSTGSSGTGQGPYRVYIRKYGFIFIDVEKIFTGKTSEEATISIDLFKVLEEPAALAITNITFNPPIKVPYGGESSNALTTSMTLNHLPTNSEYFALFRNGTRMLLGTDYSLDCSTGTVTFFSNEGGNNISVAYSYNSNLSLTNGLSGAVKTISQLYDFLRAQLFFGFNTIDGISYTSDIDLLIGSDSVPGSLGDPTKGLSYTCSRTTRFGSAGGYVDLLGTTVGGALGMNSEVGSLFAPGERVDVFATVLDSDSKLIQASVIATAYNPNDAIVAVGSATAIGTGRFRFNFTLPTDAIKGTYRVNLDATYLAGEVHDSVAFQVKDALSVSASVGTVYAQNDKVSVYAVTTNLNGDLIDSTVNVSLYYPNNTLLSTGIASGIDTGISKYNFSLPTSAPEGTYQARVNANYSGNRASTVSTFQVKRGNLRISSSVGLEYNPGDIVKTSSYASLTNGSAVNATVNVTIYSPNGAIFSNGLATRMPTEFFEFNDTLSSNANIGAYIVTIDATYQNDEAHNVLVFHVKDTLSVFASVGTFYSPNDGVMVSALTVNSKGIFVNASVNASVYYPNGTMLNNGNATEYLLGRYKYNFTLPSLAPVGTYLINLDATYSDNEIHGVLTFIISSVLEDISNIVNNIDTTVNTINQKVDVINSTVNNIRSVVNTINSTLMYVNSTVYNINTTVTNIDSNVTYINSVVTRIDSTVSYINTTVSYINTTVNDINTNILVINSTIFSMFNSLNERLGLNIGAGSSYNPGDIVDIFATTTNINGSLINATVTLSVYYPNQTVLINGSMTNLSAGRFNYSFTLPSNAVLGTYRVDVDANYSNAGTYKNLAFKVETASGSGSGGLPLNLFDTVGSMYAPGNTVYVYSTTLDSNGNLVNASTSVNIYAPNGTMMNSGGATRVLSGRTAYSYVLEADAQLGTWRVDINATYGSNTAYDSLAFVVSTSGGGGGGGGGALPSIQIDAPSIIDVNTNFGVSAFVRNNNSLLVNCGGNALLKISDWLNGTLIVDDGVMSALTTGVYNYTTSLPYQSTFLAQVSCEITGITYTSNPKIISTQNIPGGGSGSGGGSQNLNVYLDSGSFYTGSDEVIVYALTTNSSGSLVGASVNVSVFYPNMTLLINGSATSSLLGVFRYNFTLPSSAPIGTYLIKADSNYSGNEAHALDSFLVSSILDRINTIVTNINTTVNTINQNINIINTTINNIHTNVNTINSTVNNVQSTVNNINSNVTEIRSTVNNTNSIVNNIQTNVNTINSTVNNINSNITYIDAAVRSINLTVTYLNSTITYINTTVENINTLTRSINSTVILINSSVENLREYINDSFTIRLSDLGEVAAGQQFRVKLWVTSFSGNAINADPTPTISLYDPTRNTIVTDAVMALSETGIYTYNFTTSSGQTAGMWEAIITTVVNGKTNKYSDFWELETSPTQVVINDIPDKSIPSIFANVTIQNEGTGNQEYQYEYCIVSEQTNQCGGGDDAAYKSAAKLINAGQSFNTLLNLTITSSGDYYFKVVVYYGTEKSGASELFTATGEGGATTTTTTIAPSGGTGGGGGGGGVSISPAIKFGIDISGDVGDKVSISAIEGGVLSLTFDGSSQYSTATIDSITDKEVTLTLRTSPITIKLEVGETRNIDFNKDGIYELGITLISIKGKTANLEFKRLTSQISATEESADAPSISIDKERLRMILTKGSKISQFLKISNLRNTKSDASVVIETPLEPLFIKGRGNTYMFALEPLEEKEIEFIADGSIAEPGIYKTNAIVTGLNFNKVIPINVEIVGEGKALFDTSITIDKDSKVVSAGDTITADILFVNLGFTEKIDAEVIYTLLDKDGNVVLSQPETQAIETQFRKTKEFKLPAYVKPGKYTLSVKVSYYSEGEKTVAIASDSFEVVEKSELEKPFRFGLDFTYVIILALALIIGIFVWYQFKIMKILSKNVNEGKNLLDRPKMGGKRKIAKHKRRGWYRKIRRKYKKRRK